MSTIDPADRDDSHDLDYMDFREGNSDCCGAPRFGDICSDCGEHCEAMDETGEDE